MRLPKLIPYVPRRARLTLVFFVAFPLAFVILVWSDARAGDTFNFLRWERTSVTNKWLYLVGAPLRRDPDADESLARYFAIDDYTTEEARQLENVVEAEIEGRIDQVISELGIDGRLALPGSVFPPVDIEFASTPRALVISPRDHVERIDTGLLRPDLTLNDALALEVAAEEDPTRSAIVVGTGGIATYPAVVREGRSYAITVATAAHEWVHHYLSFYELGLRYNDSSDLRTINETVADIAGDDIASIVIERFGAPVIAEETLVEDTDTSPSEPASLKVDYNRVLRDLRLEVDELLDTGRIEDAEARMEEVRLELCDADYCIRRINQAYFAWYGTYAARKDAVDLLGDQLRELRAYLGSLESFLSTVSRLGSRAEVEQLWASVPTGTVGN
jgi:hypothetical protein